MKERPIIFQDWKIPKIMDGSATMTRRIVKPQPDHFHKFSDKILRPQNGDQEIKCPYGIPGDRLWVRETWGIGDHGRLIDPCLNYRADGQQIPLFYQGATLWADAKGGHVVEEFDLLKVKKGWHPSIHMPRWASRITLEITNIRVERVQKITEEDAISEGVEFLFTDEEIKQRPELGIGERHYKNYLWHGSFGQYGTGNKKSDQWPYQFSGYKTAKGSFSSLWELLHGKGAWERNDWVRVLSLREFKG